jgi:putative heme degradation protein
MLAVLVRHSIQTLLADVSGVADVKVWIKPDSNKACCSQIAQWHTMELQRCTLQIHNGSALPKQPRPSFYSIRELQGKDMPSFFRHQLLACVDNL